MDKDLNVSSNPIVAKINTIEFQKIFTDNLVALIKLFEKYNYEIRIAGGAVRDLLLDKNPTDIDFATPATPIQLKEMLAKENVRTVNANGEKHGTVTPRINDKENFEITTLRIDTATDGRHAEVKFTTDWQLDAYRRDLTINSMFLGLDGTVYDYFHGYDDLMKRRVRFVGTAEKRIQEDYLRILRYFRFYGRIANTDSEHDEEALAAIKSNISGLGKISGERIWDEMKKIFLLNMRGPLIKTFLECGASKFIGLPETLDYAEFEELVDSSKNFEKHPLLGISYLCTFLKSQQDVLRLHQRLKLSAYERDMALFLVMHKDKYRNENHLLVYKQMCMLVGNNKNVIREYVLELLKYNNKVLIFEELLFWTLPPFPISGKILESHGCSAGKKMGQVMNQLKEIWGKSDFKMSADDLLKELPTILNEMNDCDETVSKKPKIC